MIASFQHEILLIQAASAWFMTGLIWFVQLVHYPLMQRVGPAEWREYERAHQRQTTWAVAPVMLTELLTAALLLLIVFGNAPTELSSGAPKAVVMIATGLLAAVWISTFAVQVRLHTALLNSDDLTIRRALVRTNWTRTIIWTTRAALLLWLLR